MHFTQCPINPVPKTLMKNLFESVSPKSLYSCETVRSQPKPDCREDHLSIPSLSLDPYRDNILEKFTFTFPICYIYYIGRTNFTFTFHVLYIHISDKEFLDSCFVCPEKAGKQVTPHRVPCCLKLITELQQRAQT